MDIKIWVPCLLLLALARSQTSHHRSYDWRTTGSLSEWPKMTSLLPYELHHPSTESNPPISDHRPYHHMSAPYPDDSLPYSNDDSSYSGPYHNSPYKYEDVPQSVSSYEGYHNSHGEELDMTQMRIGGFAGSGDTKGFGAYDFPKNRHHDDHHPEIHHQDDHHQDIRHPDDHHHSIHHQDSMHPGSSKMDPEIVELMRLSRKHHESLRRDSMLIHPLPPPL